MHSQHKKLEMAARPELEPEISSQIMGCDSRCNSSDIKSQYDDSKPANHKRPSTKTHFKEVDEDGCTKSKMLEKQTQGTARCIRESLDEEVALSERDYDNVKPS